MLPFWKEDPVILHSGILGDLPCYPPTISFALAMDHRVQVKGPLRVDGSKITMADCWKRNHSPADPGDIIFGNLPNHHGIPQIACLLMAQNSPEAPDHSPGWKILSSAPTLFHPSRSFGRSPHRGKCKGEGLPEFGLGAFYPSRLTLPDACNNLIHRIKCLGMIYNIEGKDGSIYDWINLIGWFVKILGGSPKRKSAYSRDQHKFILLPAVF